MVLVVENRNILVEIAAAELKVKQDACADTDTFDAGVEAFPVSEAQVCGLSAAGGWPLYQHSPKRSFRCSFVVYDFEISHDDVFVYPFPDLSWKLVERVCAILCSEFVLDICQRGHIFDRRDSVAGADLTEGC